jgi:CubicO group peptidase (beta-lactamase class C family)
MTSWNDFDTYVRDAMPTWHCPGVAIAVVRGDEVVHRAAYGLRDVERDLPLTPDTRFAMASVTKSFTAMSVALLVEDGRLAWDAPVRDYVPELVLHDAYASEHLSVRDMLSHRSGLPRHDLAAWRLEVPRAAFVARLRHLRPSASFRERFQYNNLMYYALAHVVERIAGQRWEDFVHARIFEPLGMVGSNFLPEPPREGQVTALGYRVDRDEDGNPTGLVAMPFGEHTEVSPGAAGALFSTLDDQVRWLGLHVNRGRWGDATLVSPFTCEQLHQPVSVQPVTGARRELMGTTLLTYALGWSVEPYRGHTLVQHGGNVEGHSLMVGFVPEERTGVVVLTNGAMMPLRDALLYEALDRALRLEPRDWNARLHGVYDEAFRGMARGKATALHERREDAPASVGLADFAGLYRAEGYPDVAVRVAGDTLQARLVGSLEWAPLRHLHYDVFAWDLSEHFETILRVRFQMNDQGEIDRLAVPIEPEVDDVTFQRAPLELSTEVRDALLGEYATPIEGLAFAFAAAGDRIFVAARGGVPEEAVPYLLSDDRVGLRHERSRFEFARRAGAFERVTVKLPGMTLEATRRG